MAETQEWFRSRYFLAVTMTLSVAASLTGIVATARFGGTPGGDAGSPASWPRETALQANRAELLLFAHPLCSCTFATLEELDRVLAATRGGSRPDVRILFFRPRSTTDPGLWHESSLWARAAAIPGVTVAWDEDGTEARRFGAATSGAVRLYGSDRRLLFAGGITGSRGHAGDNDGADGLSAALDSTAASQPRTSQPRTSQRRTLQRRTSKIFGCSLFGESDTVQTVGPKT